MDNLVAPLILAWATSAISLTIARSHVAAGLRSWVERQSPVWGRELIHCHYCVSHWVGAGLVLIYQPRWLGFSLGIDLIVTLLAIVAVAALWSELILWIARLSRTEE